MLEELDFWVAEVREMNKLAMGELAKVALEQPAASQTIVDAAAAAGLQLPDGPPSRAPSVAPSVASSGGGGDSSRRGAFSPASATVQFDI